ncbi:MAG: NAD(P)-dependent alcohol dehydrogenase [Deltaproteobacteria bacterium]|nr:NAD(P)-dependent alcohol dehydrogenase [Deltaproteobacteria bacterium]
MTYHGYAAAHPGAALSPHSWEPEALGEREVEVAISHCGLCHSDLHLVDNSWRVSAYPLVPGHEVVGKVTRVGASVRVLRVGQRVGVGWQSDSCGHCEYCLRGEENLCPELRATAIRRHGGLADHIAVDERFAHPIPEGLPSEAAAPLLCAGATVYAPLRRYASPSSRVGVLGVGGLGHLALQFARAMGCEVTAFSTREEKAAEARAMGAHHFHTTASGPRRAKGALDLLLVTVHHDLDWRKWLNTLRPDGVLCFLGGPEQPLNIPPGALIGGQRTITGSAITGRAGMREMLAFASRNGIVPRTELMGMDQINEAMERLRRGEVRYRVVLHTQRDELGELDLPTEDSPG